MSGGFFDYKQYSVADIADDIAKIIQNNPYEYTHDTLEQFKIAVELLQKTAVYVQRIDWLLCGDDDEDSFHTRLKQELLNITSTH